VAGSRKQPVVGTVWHRVSSRLEALVDLGFLSKVSEAGKDFSYEYYYRPTDLLLHAASSASDDIGPIEWAEAHLAASFALAPIRFGDACGEEIRAALQLSLGVTGIHIDSYSISAAALALASGKHLSIGAARRAIVDLAINHPTVARLSRGYSGGGAEFASVDAMALSQMPNEVLDDYSRGGK
jgi:hypothetical protein